MKSEMEKSGRFLFLVIAIFLLFFISTAQGAWTNDDLMYANVLGTAGGQMTVHNLDTAENFTSIQAAIADPDTKDGDTISVDAGIYTKPVVINKQLKIIGVDKDTTIIDGSGRRNSIQVTADNVEIRGFTIKNGDYGIYLESSNCCVIDNYIKAIDFDGIFLSNSVNNTIAHNSISKVNRRGIRLSSSTNNRIHDNDLLENDEGIVLFASQDNIIYHNNFIDNIKQAKDNRDTNFWDNGSEDGGNYWSDHKCTGNPSNKQQYDISVGGATDLYPFMDKDGWTCTLPSPPALADPGTSDNDGNYIVNWSSVSSATNYTLEEDTNSLFSSPTTVYSGSETSKEINGKSDGTVYYQVKACNECGCSEWSNKENITIDTIPPTVNISYPSSEQMFNTTNITVNGTASDNFAVSRVEVKVGSGDWQTASGTTSWSTSVTLVPGDSNMIHARATDTAENINQTSVTVFCDITPPDITHEPITNATEGESIPISATITDDTKVANASLSYRVSGEGAWITISMDHIGDNYSATIPASNVTIAGVGYYIRAVDDATNTANMPEAASKAPYSITVITIDTIPPTVNITYPTSGQMFNTTNITVNGTASDNVEVSKVEVQVGSGSWQIASGTTSWNTSVTLVPGGSNTIYARATDTSGNTKNTSVTVICDITPPVIYHEPITNATEGENISISANITDDTEVISAISYRITGEETWMSTPMDHIGDIYSATIPASNVTTAGVEYYIEAVDNATNTAYKPATAPTTPYSITVITIDTIPPTVNISYPTSGQMFRTTNITVNGTASDIVAVGKVEVQVGSGGWQTASGTTSWNRSVTLVPGGSNTINARAADTSGNTKNTSVMVICDITPPDIYHESITSATEGENISIFANITDDTTKVASATLFYRITGEEVWITISMDHIGDIYSATIPASHVTTAGVEYYIVAVDDALNTAYRPVDAPEKLYIITVKVNVGYAIIIAGRRDDDRGGPKINLSAKNTYDILLKRGFTNESIFYLNPGMKQDVDGDGKSDVNRISSRANIEYAINTWAHDNVSVNVPLLIYMVGHCKNDKFIVNGAKEELTAPDLNNYLDHLNDKKCQNITVVYEAGNSGCFIDDLSSGTGRIIVTSTGVDASSKSTEEMGGVFSYYFFNRISEGDTIKGAFEAASVSREIKAHSELLEGVGKNPQTPLLDDNGDGKGHNISQIDREGLLAGSRYIGTQ